MPHITGPKISDSHTTAIEAAEPVVKRLQKDPGVKKITLGKIDNAGGASSRSSTRVKIIDERTRILITVSGPGSHQDISVYPAKEAGRERLVKRLENYLEEGNFAHDYLDKRG